MDNKITTERLRPYIKTLGELFYRPVYAMITKMSKLSLYCHSLLYRLDFSFEIDEKICNAIIQGTLESAYPDSEDGISDHEKSRGGYFLNDHMMDSIKSKLAEVGPKGADYIKQIDRVFEDYVVKMKEEKMSKNINLYTEYLIRTFFTDLSHSELYGNLNKEDRNVMRRYLDDDYFEFLKDKSGKVI